jgi:hypothetical protein
LGALGWMLRHKRTGEVFSINHREDREGHKRNAGKDVRTFGRPKTYKLGPFRSIWFVTAPYL